MGLMPYQFDAGQPRNQGKKVVHPAGLEPTTYCSGGSRKHVQKCRKTAFLGDF